MPIPRQPMRATERALWCILTLIVASPFVLQLAVMGLAYKLKMIRLNAAIAPNPSDVERYERIRGLIAKKIGKSSSDIEVFDSFKERGQFVIVHIAPSDLKKKQFSISSPSSDFDKQQTQNIINKQPDLYLGPAVIPDSMISIPNFGSPLPYDSKRRVAAGSYSDSYN